MPRIPDLGFVVVLGALLIGHFSVHAYHTAIGIPPPAQVRWTLIVPLWCAFSLVHAFYSLGWRRTLWLTGLALTISFAFEFVGVKTGWPFGAYYYTDVLGPKVASTVPVVIPFAYLMMLYPSHVITNLILDGTPVSAPRGFWGMGAAAMLTALVMTAWDLTMDPAMVSTVAGWVWVEGGPYFGIPIRNFMGWVLVVVVIAFLYRRIEARVPVAPMGSPRRWIALGPIIGYGTLALADVLVGVPVATRILPPFAMGIPLLAACVRLFEAPLNSRHS